MGSLGFLSRGMHNPFVGLNSFYYIVADGVLRYFLIKHADYDARDFDPKTGGEGGKWVAGIRQQSEEDDASDADLSAFAQHGGKLVLVHGTADTTIPTDASVLLYRRIAAGMGQQQADAFLRLYLIPGFGHGRGVFDAGFDAVTVLDAWADRQAAPQELIVTDQHGDGRRKRPLCRWPEWPKFKGGDPAQAGSFACVAADR